MKGLDLIFRTPLLRLPPEVKPSNHLDLKASRACIHEFYRSLANTEAVFKWICHHSLWLYPWAQYSRNKQKDLPVSLWEEFDCMLSQLLLKSPSFWSACIKLLTATLHKAQKSQWSPHILPLAHSNAKAIFLTSPWKKLVHTSCMSTYVASIWRPQMTHMISSGAFRSPSGPYWTNKKPVSNGHASTSYIYPLGLGRGSRQKHLFLSFSLEKIWIHLSQLLPGVLVLISLHVEANRDPTGCLIELMVTFPTVSPWLHR